MTAGAATCHQAVGGAAHAVGGCVGGGAEDGVQLGCAGYDGSLGGDDLRGK